jgi:hypothetical protein
VNAAGTSLEIGSGVAGSLRRAAAGPINDAATSQGPVDPGEVAVTDAFELDADHVIHAATMPQYGDRRATADSIRAATRNARAAADVDRAAVTIATKCGFVPFDGQRSRDAATYIEAEYIDAGIVDADDLVMSNCIAPDFLGWSLGRSLSNLGSRRSTATTSTTRRPSLHGSTTRPLRPPRGRLHAAGGPRGRCLAQPRPGERRRGHPSAARRRRVRRRLPVARAV